MKLHLKNATEKDLRKLEKAQAMVYDAWEASSLQKALALVTKATITSPYCADAWSFLASCAEPGSDEELLLLENAVVAGQAALGDGFKEMRGEFWGWIETRPYMRAHHGLAQGLMERGRRAEAIQHLTEMIDLNPNDNQGIRYELIGHLVDDDDHERIETLKTAYEDEGMAMWLWPLALSAFRLNGDGPESRAALKVALESNKHVPNYLVGKKKIPKSAPEYYGIGDVNEAVMYAKQFADSWAKTRGAIDWLCEMQQSSARKRKT